MFTIEKNVTYQTTDGTPVNLPFFSLMTGQAAVFTALIGCLSTVGDMAVFTSVIRAKNVGGTVTITVVESLVSSVDTGIAGATVGAAVNGTDVVITVTGVVGKTINWAGKITIWST